MAQIVTSNSASPNVTGPKQSALLRVLKTTLTFPAQITFYASALGALALFSGSGLPPDLSLIAGGLGVNALSSILERVAKGESVSENDIRRQVQVAIDESSIVEKLSLKDTQVMIAKLFRQSDLIGFAIHESEYEILQRLADQAEQYDVLRSELDSDISEIRDAIRKLATREQGDEIIELQRLQLIKLETIESFLKQHPPTQEQSSSQFDRIDLPSRANQQFVVAQSEVKIAEDPTDWKSWLKQAVAYYELEEMDKAIIAINKAWGLNNQSTDIILARGCILAEYAMASKSPKSMLEEAIRLFESLREKIESSLVDYNIGNCLAGLGNHLEAIKQFDQALGAKPNPKLAAQIWKNRGTSFFHLGNYEEEIDSYKMALELNPNLFEAYASWAETECRHNHFHQARDLFEKAFKLNPERELESYAQIYSLAYALWRLGDLEEAYRRINQVLALQPIYQDAVILKGYLISQLWRKSPRYIDDAARFFEDWIIDHPDDMEARNELYLIFNSDENQNGAGAVLKRLALSPTAPPQSLYHYAMAMEKEGKDQEALNYLEKAFARSQEHHIVHALARLKRKLGDYPSAIEFYELALRDVSHPVSILHSIADCYYFLGRYEDCVRVLAGAILLDPRDKDSWNNLGYSLAQLGKDGLFSVFPYYIYKLGKKGVSDDEAGAAIDELLSRLSVDFGEEFVDAIRQIPARHRAKSSD